MKKIIVIGTTGSGKSTLAKKISKKLNYPYIQLDKLYWKADWVGSSDEEFFQKIEAATSQKSWVLDGNYTRSSHLTWTKADTVIWIDLPFWQTLYQNISRSIKRAIIKEELWEGTGNRESFSRLFSRDSFVGWLFQTYRPNKIRNEAKLKSEEYKHIKFYRLKSRYEIMSFIENLLL